MPNPTFDPDSGASVMIEASRHVDTLEVLRVVISALPQAVFGVDAQGRSLGIASPAAEEALGNIDATDHVWTVVRPTDRACARWLELGWSALHDPLVPYELGLTQLPSRFEGRNGQYRLGYARLPFPAPHGAILVSLMDASATEAVLRSENALRETQQLATRAIRDPSGMRDFLEEGRQLVSELAVEAIDTSVRLRLIHTLKGNAALLGLQRLAEHCHVAEEALLEGEASSNVLRELRASWQGLDENLTTWLDGQSTGELDISLSDQEGLLDAIAEGLPHDQLADMVSQWRDESVGRHFDRLGSLARGLAARLGKGPVTVDWEAHNTRASSRLQPFWGVAAHLVRNAVDHGIETTEERSRNGKERGGRLHFRADRDAEGALTLRFSDDGRGIDFDKLAGKFEDGELPEDRTQLIFMDGLSSRDRVSEISGRGVGMGAVKATVERLGGRIEVTTAIGEGTTFSIHFGPEEIVSEDGLLFDEDEDGFLLA